ncbi:unnamed protein product, partial [Scytosiphon promiscuus]
SLPADDKGPAARGGRRRPLAPPASGAAGPGAGAQLDRAARSRVGPRRLRGRAAAAAAPAVLESRSRRGWAATGTVWRRRAGGDRGGARGSSRRRRHGRGCAS